MDGFKRIAGIILPIVLAYFASRIFGAWIVFLGVIVSVIITVVRRKKSSAEDTDNIVDAHSVSSASVDDDTDSNDSNPTDAVKRNPLWLVLCCISGVIAAIFLLGGAAFIITEPDVQLFTNVFVLFVFGLPIGMPLLFYCLYVKPNKAVIHGANRRTAPSRIFGISYGALLIASIAVSFFATPSTESLNTSDNPDAEPRSRTVITSDMLIGTWTLHEGLFPPNITGEGSDILTALFSDSVTFLDNGVGSLRSVGRNIWFYWELGIGNTINKYAPDLGPRQWGVHLVADGFTLFIRGDDGWLGRENRQFELVSLENLVGTWRLEGEASSYINADGITFYYDGNGVFINGESASDFVWNVEGPVLSIDQSEHNGGGYLISVDESSLTFWYRDGTTSTWQLIQRGLIPELNATPYVNDARLVGRWVWDGGDDLYYVFYYDGRATLNFPGNIQTYSWTVIDENQLLFVSGLDSTIWNYSISGNVLALSNERFMDGATLNFIRIDTSYLPEPIPEYITIRGEQYSTSLTELRLTHMGLTNEEIEPLRYMTNLTALILWGNQISDLAPLSYLTNLMGIGLDDNEISDLTPLSNLTNLAILSLPRNNVHDISPLSDLENLSEIWLDDNPITDWSPVAHVPAVSGRP